MINQEHTFTVQKAYIAYYGRPADYAGLVWWADQLADSGGNLSAIMDAFGNSAESQSLYGGLTSEERVQKVYQQVFNRDPDQAGKDWWVEELDSGRSTTQSLALSMLNGAQNDDLATINKKLEVAVLFTDTLHEQNADEEYSGAEDAQILREMLSSVTASTEASSFEPKIHSAIAAIQTENIPTDNVILDAHYSLGSNPDFILTSDEAIYLITNSTESNSEGARFEGVYIQKIDDKTLTEIDSTFVAIGDEINGFHSPRFAGNAAIDPSDGDIVVAGIGGLVKLDNNLNLQSSVSLNTSPTNFLDVGFRSDGKIVVAGSQGQEAESYDGYISILNDDLSVHRQIRLDNNLNLGTNENVENFFITFNNGIVAEVTTSPGANSTLMFDENLNLHHSVYVDPDFIGVLSLDEGRDFFIYEHAIVEMNDNYDTVAVWSTDLMRDWRYAEVSNDRWFLYGVTGNPTIVELELNDNEFEIERNWDVVTQSGDTLRLNTDIIITDDLLALEAGGNLFTLSDNMNTSPNLLESFRLYHYEVEGSFTLNDDVSGKGDDRNAYWDIEEIVSNMAAGALDIELLSPNTGSTISFVNDLIM